jgi:hypothetical protein
VTTEKYWQRQKYEYLIEIAKWEASGGLEELDELDELIVLETTNW